MKYKDNETWKDMSFVPTDKKKIDASLWTARVTCLQNSGTSQHAPTDRICSPPSIQVHTLQSAEPVSNLFTLASAYLFGCLQSGRVISMTLRHASIYHYCDHTSMAFYNGGPAGDITCFKTMVLSRSLSGQTKATLANLVRIKSKSKWTTSKLSTTQWRRMEEWRYSSTNSEARNFAYRVSCDAPGKYFRFPLIRMLSGPQCRTGRCTHKNPQRESKPYSSVVQTVA